MISKFLRPIGEHFSLACKLNIRQPSRCSASAVSRTWKANRFRSILLHQPIRHAGEFVPPTQYDSKMPKRLNLVYALRVYWEIIPLILVTSFAFSICIFSILWAINNKVDVVFTARSRRNISRTMDLRHPTVHKLITINDRYLPWPEMQDVLDKMVIAEKRALVRLQSCDQSK